MENKRLNIDSINEELKILLKENLYNKLKNDEEIDKNTINFLRKTIKNKLEKIKNKIKDGKR